MRRVLLLVLVGSVAASVVAFAPGAVDGVPRMLAELEAFRIERVEVDGLRHLSRGEVEARLALPAVASVWDDPAPWEARLAAHPLVRTVDVRPRLPSTLVVRIEERSPVALMASPLLEPVDVDGRRLPLDPAAERLDLPLLHVPPGAGSGPRAVRVLASEVARLGEEEPAFAALLSELHWRGPGDLAARWGDPGVVVRFRPPLAARRVREAMTVLEDASGRRPERPVESVDLRWADQVVVRYARGGGT